MPLGPHWKHPFAILHTNIDLTSLAQRCPGYHVHQHIHGSAATASGANWPELAKVWAAAIAQAVRRHSQSDDHQKIGFDKPWVNVLADHAPWKVDRKWRWRQPSHINLLEQRTVHALVKEQLHRRRRGRLLVLVDSRVTLCSGAKGRSPSLALGSLWRRTLPWLLGGRLLLGMFFVPSRKNPIGPSLQRTTDGIHISGALARSVAAYLGGAPAAVGPLASWRALAACACSVGGSRAQVVGQPARDRRPRLRRHV